jgi:hypothetical protein
MTTELTTTDLIIVNSISLDQIGHSQCAQGNIQVIGQLSSFTGK